MGIVVNADFLGAVLTDNRTPEMVRKTIDDLLLVMSGPGNPDMSFYIARVFHACIQAIDDEYWLASPQPGTEVAVEILSNCEVIGGRTGSG